MQLKQQLEDDRNRYEAEIEERKNREQQMIAARKEEREKEQTTKAAEFDQMMQKIMVSFVMLACTHTSTTLPHIHSFTYSIIH